MGRTAGENGLRWINDPRTDTFTLTLAEGLTPYELLRAVGAEEHRIIALTRFAAWELLYRSEDHHISDLEWLDWEDDAAVARLTDAGFLPTPPDMIVRAGAVDGWAYALEENHGLTGLHIAQLSERGRAFVVHRNAKGFTRVDYGLHGRAVSTFEPGLPHLFNGVPPEEALGFVHRGGESATTGFLRFLEDELGLYIPWEETETELPAAAFDDPDRRTP
ncbi:DUF6461 domain-containing protein [Streptomyces sp. NPDC060194]|uniref:DUF6461 domain-containing protein n=1 Tax=Streptomyces sp. NPDC060194 TaxID=3347069 RepID=UPI003646AB26